LGNSNSDVTNDQENNLNKSIISIGIGNELVKTTKELNLAEEEIDFDIQQHLLLDQDFSSEDEDFEYNVDDHKTSEETEEFNSAIEVFKNANDDLTEEEENDRDKDVIYEDTIEKLPETIVDQSNYGAESEPSVDDIQTQLLFDQDLSDDEDDEDSQENFVNTKEFGRAEDNLVDDKFSRSDDEKLLIEDYDDKILQMQGLTPVNKENERHATTENSTVKENNLDEVTKIEMHDAHNATVDKSFKCPKCAYESSDESMVAKHKKYIHDGVYTSLKPAKEEQTRNTYASTSMTTVPCSPSTNLLTNTSIKQFTARERIKKNKKKLFTATSGPQEF